ncbi:hypothetical protein HNV11_09840 [Spirosoma taeanense]|uniref:Uncharacterized protein n=1 Tax=Spirosoma taeanense TaxID=2735870 RepID=A0A6M5Y8S9_9BACT|nr:hypothetical protein [Spirosoma taeanense]QJW89660.1 hypothetical protein HNV11_09840 [Spirosoma taeanense]
MRICLLCLLPALIFMACARKTSVTAELTPRSLKAINLEETISRRDEVMMAYSLTSYDAQNKPVAVVNGGWGVEQIQKGQQLNLSAAGPQQAQPIALTLPRNGRLVASLVLIEVDNYGRAKELQEQVRRVHNVVSGPAALFITATELLTPLKYVAAGLAASGVGLKLMDQFDDDDLLGQSSVELSEAELRQKKQRYVRVPATFTGQNLRDAFAYKLEYDISLKAVRIQPARQ